MDDENNNEESHEIEDEQPEYREIDPLFHSFLLEGPFEECVDCGCELENGAYVIQKTYVGEEVVFECALCDKCSARLHGEMSQESFARVNEFVSENRKLKEVTDQCNICEKPQSECREFSASAICIGAQMIIKEYPIMICGDCNHKVAELLSPKTRGALDDFIGENFDGPPAMEVPLPNKEPAFFL